jgi:hypothetical protein
LRVPNSIVDSRTSPTISGVFSIEIIDGGGNLDADWEAGPKILPARPILRNF